MQYLFALFVCLSVYLFRFCVASKQADNAVYANSIEKTV